MLEATVVITILLIFGAVCAALMAANPKDWRYWWMRRFDYLDIDYTREQRYKQQNVLRWMSVLSFLLCTAGAAFGIYMLFHTITQSQRPRSDAERIEEENRRHVDEIRSLGLRNRE
jgi:hypothetical protein